MEKFNDFAKEFNELERINKLTHNAFLKFRRKIKNQGFEFIRGKIIKPSDSFIKKIKDNRKRYSNGWNESWMVDDYITERIFMCMKIPDTIYWRTYSGRLHICKSFNVETLIHRLISGRKVFANMDLLKAQDEKYHQARLKYQIEEELKIEEEYKEKKAWIKRIKKTIKMK